MIRKEVEKAFDELSSDKAMAFLASEVEKAIRYAQEHLSPYDSDWIQWANGWLLGTDRSSESAIKARRRAEGEAMRATVGQAYAWEKVTAAEAAACFDGGPYKRSLSQASLLLGLCFNQLKRIREFSKN